MTGKCDKKYSAVVRDGLLYRHEIKIMKVWDDFAYTLHCWRNVLTPAHWLIERRCPELKVWDDFMSIPALLAQRPGLLRDVARN